MSIRPQDLPELRAEVREQMAITKLIEPLFEGPANRAADLAELTSIFQAAIDAVTLFHVTAPMTELVCTASESLELFTPDRDDLPSPGGMVIFDGRIPKKIRFEDGCTTYLRGALWFTHSERPELTIMPIAEPHDGIQVPGRLVAYPFAYFGAVLGKKMHANTADSALWNVDIVSLLLTTWLLMKQPLAEDAEVQPDRAARRRLRRAGHEPAPVRVIELRRPKTSGHANSESNREYHHRWITRGHWRQQWHPKRQLHRPVWIAPHIKGPEGAPLIGGEKVYALKR